VASRIRTFLGLGLDAGPRDRLVGLRDRLAVAFPAVKWVEPANYHVTLHFLGDVDARDLVGVCRAVQTVASDVPPFEITLAAPGGFPNARRPRTVYASLGEGAAEVTAMYEALIGPLHEVVAYRREERIFTPHVTLGRVEGGEDPAALGAALAKHASWGGGGQAVREVLVYASELRPDGPVYTVSGRARLGG
jgi:2'-5' RNA ligase